MAEYIEREAVLDYIRYKVCQGEGNIEHRCQRDSCAYCGICEIMCDISSMPAADVQPVDRWISVDDALPEKDGYYLVLTQGIHNPTIDIAGFWHYAEWVQKEIRENYWNKYDKVLYWQPLPDLP